MSEFVGVLNLGLSLIWNESEFQSEVAFENAFEREGV